MTESDLVDRIEAWRAVNNDPWLELRELGGEFIDWTSAMAQRMENNRKTMDLVRNALQLNPARAKTLLDIIAAIDSRVIALTQELAK